MISLRQSDISKSPPIKDSISYRIDFIKKLLKEQIFDSLIDFDQTNTECFVGSRDSESGESHDTRVLLKKRVLNFVDVIRHLGHGGKLTYIKSGTTGHTFKGVATDDGGEFEYAVKVVAYPKVSRYGDLHDSRRPENAELMMNKLLSYFIVTKQTPHVVLPYGTFDTSIELFTNLINFNAVEKDNGKYNEFITNYKNGNFYEDVSILISEWANRGDLLEFIKKNHTKFSPLHWKVFFFQIISTLSVIQNKFPSFRHNDLKANNILVHKIDKNNKNFTYTINGNMYKVPNIGYQIKIWDFDFACIPGIINNTKVSTKWANNINIKPEQNRYYDLHYFFSTLMRKGFFPQFMNKKNIPQETKDFVTRIVPQKYRETGKYVHEKGRLLVNDEYIIPDEILVNDPYFEEFRHAM